MNTINVLMCGGRRTGKTAIMAAMEANMQDRFPGGEITLTLDNSGRLQAFRDEQSRLFMPGQNGEMTYYAEDNPTQAKSEHKCRVGLRGRAGLKMNFIDIPGEWYVHPEKENEVLELIRSAQILVIAVDSPHLVEKQELNAEYGMYHEVFNRPEEITRLIEKATQGDTSPRMILFVPVKCELYRNNGEKGRKKDMQYLLSKIHTGYARLIADFKDSPTCAIACAPCITMGGMEFLHFVPRREGSRNSGNLLLDEYGQPLKDISIDERIGLAVMNYRSEYVYLTLNGKRYYKPEDCDQPLDYILLFLVGVGNLRKKYFMRRLIDRLFDLPDQKVLDDCKGKLLNEIKTNPTQGFEIIHDPYLMFR